LELLLASPGEDGKTVSFSLKKPSQANEIKTDTARTGNSLTSTHALWHPRQVHGVVADQRKQSSTGLLTPVLLNGTKHFARCSDIGTNHLAPRVIKR
jgi:hypothetical protein